MLNKILAVSKKYSLMKKISSVIISRHKYFICGFEVNQLREGKEIAGYEIKDFSGLSGVLASKSEIYPHKNGKYFVNSKFLEELVSKNFLVQDKALLIEDLGPFFTSNNFFTDKFREILSSDMPVLVFARDIKNVKTLFEELDDALVLNISEKSFTSDLSFIEKWLGEKLKEIKNDFK